MSKTNHDDVRGARYANLQTANAFSRQEWQCFAEQLHWTEHQLDLVKLAFAGLPNKIIAHRLGCGRDNVNKMLGRICKRMGIHRKIDLPHTLLALYLNSAR